MSDVNHEVNSLSTLSAIDSCPFMHSSSMVPKRSFLFECGGTFGAMSHSSNLDIKHGPWHSRPPDNETYLEHVPDGGSDSISIEQNSEDLSFERADLCFDKREGSENLEMKVIRNDQFKYEVSDLCKNLQSRSSVYKEYPAPGLDGPLDFPSREFNNIPNSKEETSKATEKSLSGASPTVTNEKKSASDHNIPSKKPTEFIAAYSDGTAAGLESKDKVDATSESEVRTEGGFGDSDGGKYSIEQPGVNSSAMDSHLFTNTRRKAAIVTTIYGSSMLQLHVVLQLRDSTGFGSTSSTIYISWPTHEQERQWQIAWYVTNSHVTPHILISMILWPHWQHSM